MLETRLPSVVSVWMNGAYCCRKQSRDILWVVGVCRRRVHRPRWERL